MTKRCMLQLSCCTVIFSFLSIAAVDAFSHCHLLSRQRWRFLGAQRRETSAGQHGYATSLFLTKLESQPSRNSYWAEESKTGYTDQSYLRYGNRQSKQVPQKFEMAPRLRKMLYILTASLFLSARKAVAASTAALALPPRLRAKKYVMKIVHAAFLVVVAANVAQAVRVHRRQRRDATSEWGRYAAHPAARGRAVMNLAVKLLPFWIADKMLFLFPAKQKAIRVASGDLFSRNLLRLGPLYIKIGQILSCRDKLLPEEWKEGLAVLQDRVPARSGQEALELAYGAVGSRERFHELFTDFDTTPLAAASLGQVHKAVLRRDNTTVAVKVQRAFLREIYDQDLNLLRGISKFADNVGKRSRVGGVDQSWSDIFSDTEAILYREIDYRDEASNGIRFAQDFGLGYGGAETEVMARSLDDTGTLPSAAEWLRAPYVYQDLSSEKILIMEFVSSIKITDTAKLEAAKVTAEDKEHLADSLARAYLRQFCVHGFFSTDPHPGNLGVEVFDHDSSLAKRRPRIVFYDFGQVASLTSDQSEGVLDVIEATIDMDASRCVSAFQKMGVLKDDADLDKVLAKVKDNFETGKIKVKGKKLKKKGIKLNEFNSTGTSKMTKESDSEVMSFFTLPAEYAFVARAVSQMDGVGKSLDPDFDFISSAAPYLVEAKGAKSYLKDELSKSWSKFLSTVQSKIPTVDVVNEGFEKQASFQNTTDASYVKM